MEEYTRLKGGSYTGYSAQCLYRYVYGKEDRFFIHNHDYYEIFITVSGIVHHWINGKTQILPENSLVFIRPDDTHGYMYKNDESIQTEYVNLTFTREIAVSLFEYLAPDFPTYQLLNAPMPPTVVLNNTAKRNILSQLGTLNTLNWENKEALKMRMKSILADIFVQNFSSVQNHDESEYPLWFSVLLKEMETEKNFIAGADRMVELSQRSREHLSRTVKKYLNMSLSEYINNLRVNYAANLLLNSNSSIIDVCFICGFQNVGYFYETFKNKYGIPPAQFVKKYKNQD